MRVPAAGWFASKGYTISRKYNYILASRDDWVQNIIHPEVAEVEPHPYLALRKVQALSRGRVTAQQPGRGAIRGLMPFLLSLNPPAAHARIHVVYIQDVVSAIRESVRHEWLGEFERKYGLGEYGTL